MEIILQSSEDHPLPLEAQPQWQQVLQLLEVNGTLHRYSILYWSDNEEQDPAHEWRISGDLRRLIERRPDSFG